MNSAPQKGPTDGVAIPRINTRKNQFLKILFFIRGIATPSVGFTVFSGNRLNHESASKNPRAARKFEPFVLQRVAGILLFFSASSATSAVQKNAFPVVASSTQLKSIDPRVSATSAVLLCLSQFESLRGVTRIR